MIDGVFEIVSIIDSTHITVSILRSDPAAAIAIGSASGLTWSIKTYAPQISVAETQLSHRLRCLPGWENATVTLAELENAEAVRLGVPLGTHSDLTFRVIFCPVWRV